MMKSKHVAAFVIAISYSTAMNAQDPVIMEINDKKILKSEFEAVYKKNNGKEVNNTTKSVKEYVDLFSLFKSKVFEAESMGLDTLTSFKTELAGYRRQLAAPYLTDRNTNENLVTEAYERMKTEVRSSHILIRVDEGALPKDTLEAWTRANIIRNAVLGKLPSASDISNYEKLLKNSTEVAKLLKGKDSSIYRTKLASVKNLPLYLKDAKDRLQDIAAKTSDDPSALDNKGDLNFWTALELAYPYETAMYNTKVGEVAPLVRTKFGYHVLKVYDKRPYLGEVTVAHIMARFPKDATEKDKENSKTKIFELKEKLKTMTFEEVARQFSDDKQSSDRGGLLQPFKKTGRLPKSFEDAAFDLKANNQVSEPVMTPVGWHLIKRVDIKTLASFDEVKNELKNRVTRESRSQMGRNALIAKVKKENNYKENLKNRDEILREFDSTYLKAAWTASRVSKLGNKEIINIGGKSYTQMDFAKYLESQMVFRGPSDMGDLLRTLYKTWSEEMVISYEDGLLDQKYPDFKNLLREYRDGILLFDLTDQKVWSKAVKDTAGLKDFYEKNKNNYLWGERAEVSTYKCLNDKMAAEVRKMLKAGKKDKEIVEALNKTSQLNVNLENVTYLKGENKNIDANWKQGVVATNIKDEKENKVLVIVVNKILPKSPKNLNECRGMATADYQNYLEAEWLKYLRDKYKVKVHEDVLSTVK
ncbi:MAG: PpiC-type peptidyl-prolyl cis-trans isomerase [Bacteroidetes bacterium]|jgi:peptidyl-prolyl cis-trans isomerase SurA|nr:PpiC-type peptidyl-prolyl cis-trans isomerase [Bacteroidota bacterium]